MYDCFIKKDTLRAPDFQLHPPAKPHLPWPAIAQGWPASVLFQSLPRTIYCDIGMEPFGIFIRTLSRCVEARSWHTSLLDDTFKHTVTHRAPFFLLSVENSSKLVIIVNSKMKNLSFPFRKNFYFYETENSFSSSRVIWDASCTGKDRENRRKVSQNLNRKFSPASGIASFAATRNPSFRVLLADR